MFCFFLLQVVIQDNPSNFRTVYRFELIGLKKSAILHCQKRPERGEWVLNQHSHDHPCHEIQSHSLSAYHYCLLILVYRSSSCLHTAAGRHHIMTVQGTYYNVHEKCTTVLEWNHTVNPTLWSSYSLPNPTCDEAPKNRVTGKTVVLNQKSQFLPNYIGIFSSSLGPQEIIYSVDFDGFICKITRGLKSCAGKGK
jgi:hypothetical protein